MSQLVVTIANPSAEPNSRWLTRSRFAAFIAAALVIQVVLAVVFALKPCSCKNNDTNKSSNSSAMGLYSDPDHIRTVLDGDFPRELSCKWPLVRSVRVDSVYPSASAVYAPPCVSLHRCGNESGCCTNVVSICVAKSATNVTLPIRILEFGPNKVFRKRIDDLTFINHTECVCTEVQ